MASLVYLTEDDDTYENRRAFQYLDEEADEWLSLVNVTPYQIYGFEGDDRIVLGNSGQQFYNGLGTLDGGEGDDYLELWGIDGVVRGGRGNDLLLGGYAYGDDGSDRGEGLRLIDGGAGDDIVGSGTAAFGGTGSDEVLGGIADGGDGNDLVSGTESRTGGAGRDVFLEFRDLYRDDTIYDDDTGEFVFRVMTVGSNADFDSTQDRIASPWHLIAATQFTGVAGQMVYHEPSNRTRVDRDGDGAWDLSMEGQRDPGQFILLVLDGTEVDETASGSGLLLGRDGNDRLSGAPAEDWLFGGFGDDVLAGGRGDDLLVGGAGKDRLTGSIGDDDLDGGDGADTLSAGDGDDLASGGAGNDVVAGGGGADTLLGGEESDRLNGGAGDDTILGGAGDDYLTGGAGADTFVFAPGDSGAVLGTRDRIADFEAGTDLIDLTAFAGASVTIEEGVTHDLVLIDQGNDGPIDSALLVAVVGTAHLAVSDLLL